jgi:phosphoesterase RecJ-like protein
MKEIKMNYAPTIEEICAQIKQHDNIVVAGHEAPDGDSIGSCLALCLALNAMGKKARAVIEHYDMKFNVIPGQEFVYRGDIEELAPSLFICVDCSNKNRLGAASAVLEKTSEIICIDHHESDDYFGKYNYVNSKASATCELIFNVLDALGVMNSDIASAIYAGIIYDTGGFLHQSTTPECLDIVSRLIKLNIPFTNIYNAILKERSVNASKMFGLAFSRLKLEGGICFSYITQDDLLSIGATTQDLDQISNELLSTVGAIASVFVYEKGHESSKVSFRSRVIDVCAIAKSFGGGGHERAAGASISMSAKDALKEAIEKTQSVIKSYDK